MYSTTYIRDLINDGIDAEISYRNLHPPLIISNKKTDESIKVPYLSLTNKYRDFLEPFVIEVNLIPEEEILYKFKPKLLSLELYGTTELWASLLELNNMISIIEFRPKKIKVYDPDGFKAMINEILIMEGILK